MRIDAVAALFEEFNALYFGGRLPAIKVRFMARRANKMGAAASALYYRGLAGQYRVEPPRKYVYDRAARGWRRNESNEVRRTIALSPWLPDEGLPEILIHEMIHAAGFPHGEAFAAEARRVRDLGAPVQDEDCLTVPHRGTGGPIRLAPYP